MRNVIIFSFKFVIFIYWFKFFLFFINLYILFQIKVLKEEVQIAHPFKEKMLPESEHKVSNKNSFREGLKQMKTMFCPPFLINFFLVNVLQFAVNMG